ncbi:MAG: gliding motility-associated C-terminal domain-containing protein [Bacteroidetes bacterium]|nr:gliding motility-associated C-terminal domain-containing protein [Bacteroidota bacterium]
MKNIALLVSMFLVASVSAQNITMVNGTFSQCGGKILDPGGAGDYPASANVTTTICPTIAGSSVRLDFTQFATEAGLDELEVFNGPNTGSPLIGTFDGTLIPFSVQSNNPGGCITLRFTSDASIQNPGFSANISCVFPCQPVIANINSSTPAVSAGTIDLCLGETLVLNGSANYPSTTTLYTQSNATSSFDWDFGDGTYGNGQTVTKTFAGAGVYDLDLNVTDINGCDNSNDINILVRVSDVPKFTGTSALKPSICLGQTNTLTGVAQETEIVYFCNSNLSDTTFVPDGVGVAYTTSITLDCFDPATQIATVNDLQSVCMALEHSYLGDLDITLTCPNGTTIDLFFPPLTSLNEVYLGEPVDNDNSATLGDPYNYCFTMGAAQTWSQVGFPALPPPLGVIPTQTFTDNDGVVQANKYYIPAGNYRPQQSFAGLVGCPLNGDWTLTITDGLAQDNGTIFNWDLNFSPALYTTIFNSTPTLSDTAWAADPSIVSYSKKTIVVQPTTLGTSCYTFVATDEFGCDHDTTVCFTVLNGENSSFNYSQAGYCLNAANPTPTKALNGGTFSATPAGLSINAGTGTINLATSTPGTYTVRYLSPGIGCQTSTTRTVVVSPTPSATITGTQTICQGNTATIQVSFTGVGPWNFTYNNGVTNSSLSNISANPYTFTTSAAGNYTLVSVSNAACSGAVSGSAVITVNSTVSSSNTTATCDMSNTTYVVSFRLNGGNPASYNVTGMNGGTITNPSAGVYIFTSNAIASASPNYSFNFNDGNNCNVVNINGSQNCNCSATALLSGGGAICHGDSAMFTVDFTGTPPFQFTAFNGTSNKTFMGINTTTFSFYDSIPGGYSLVSMQDVTCGGSVGGTGILSLKPTPSLTVMDNAICEGSNYDITATPSQTGGTYSWSPGALPATQTITVSPASSQYYYVNYTLNGCSTIDSSYITVNQVPTITALDTAICQGNSVVVTSNVDLPGGTYDWQPSGQTTSSITITPPSTSDYTVTYTLNGCSSSDISTVSVGAQPTISTSSRTICPGETATLTTAVNPSGGTFLWANPPAPAGSNMSTLQVSPTATTTYPVSYSIGGCSASASATVTVKFAPSVSLKDTSICIGNSATLIAVVDSLGGGYLWTPGNLPTTPQITVTPANTTTYQLVYTVGTCTDTATSVVTVTPAPTVTVSAPSICVGDVAVITANPTPAGGTYNWTASPAIAGQTSQTVNDSPVVNTNYNVTYSLNGCVANGGTTLIVRPRPLATISGDREICEGETLMLTGSPNNASYAWNGPNLFNANSKNITINNVTANMAGTYTFTATVNGCSSTADTVVIINVVNTDFSANLLTGCAPLSVDFSNTTAGSVNCAWDFGDGSTSSDCGLVSHLFTNAGTYTVSLVVTDANGCIDQEVKNQYVVVSPIPDARFNLSSTELSEDDPNVLALNKSVGAVNYVWTVNGIQVSTDESPNLEIDFNGNLTASIGLYAISQGGCIDSLFKEVSLIEDVIFYIPNSFTPDGNSVNNEFMPVLSSGMDKDTYVLRIYNRWGEVLFESRDVNVGWDGTYSQNRLAPSGVYLYEVQFLLKETDERKRRNGFVNLQR